MNLTRANRLLAIGLISFLAWLVLLMLALSLEHTSLGKAVFASRSATIGYLAVQATLTIAALAANGWVLVRGPTRNRFIVSLPLLLLLLYGGMLLAGPG